MPYDRLHYDRTVFAYHGCEADVADRLVAGDPFLSSMNKYDWLGHGIYFWEYGVDRAVDFANEQQHRQGKCARPAVVGAVIKLGNCFDLLDVRYTRDLAEGYRRWRKIKRINKEPLPQNIGCTPDRERRRLDCAVFNFYLDALAQVGTTYDTIRGAFREGRPVYPGSGVYEKTHIQIAVRNPACILGVFRPFLLT